MACCWVLREQASHGPCLAPLMVGWCGGCGVVFVSGGHALAGARGTTVLVVGGVWWWGVGA